MKNLKFIVLIGLFTSFVLSCAKEEVNTPQNTFNDEAVVLVQKDVGGGDIGEWRKYFPDNGQGIPVCGYPAYDCFPIDIAIFPEHSNAILEIFNSISNGTHRLTVVLIKKYGKMLIEHYYVDEDYIVGFLRGIYSLESAENISDNIFYLRFVDASGASICVYPMQLP